MNRLRIEMIRKKRILVLEDVEKWQVKVKAALKPLEHDVDFVRNTVSAKRKIADHFYELLVLDLSMVEGDKDNVEGLHFLGELQRSKLFDARGVLIITAYPSVERVRQAFATYRVTDFFLKQAWNEERFREKVIEILEERKDSVGDLIEHGESETLEFKATLRWNLFTKKIDKKLEYVCLKTIAAFLNSRGGVLLIGVKDDGEVLGISSDKFTSTDKMRLHLAHIVERSIGPTFSQFLTSSVEMVQSREVLRVDCAPSRRAAYLKEGEEEHFYIRVGPATSRLPTSQIHDYIRQRFSQPPPVSP